MTPGDLRDQEGREDGEVSYGVVHLGKDPGEEGKDVGLERLRMVLGVEEIGYPL